MFFVAHRKWKRLGRPQHFVGVDDDLDVTGWHLRILGIGAPFVNSARDTEASLRPEFLEVRELLRTKNELGKPIAVAQIDKADAAKVPDFVRPAVENYLESRVFGA